VSRNSDGAGFGRHIVKRILLIFLSFTAIGLMAPFFSAGPLGRRVLQRLEHSLNRKVEVAAVRFSLLRGPGFLLRQAIIYDDPAGVGEPLAFVDSIEANLDLLALLQGRLEFASLRFDSPSVNLIKTADGLWNFQAFLAANPAVKRWPEIMVRDGRLNFTVGGVKSVFYFGNTDLDIKPASGSGLAFNFKFSGELRRSDRSALLFGAFSGRGLWEQVSNRAGRLEMDMTLEQSSLGEITALIYGYDLGIHGQVNAKASLRGDIESLDVRGALQVRDIHRWDLLPPYAEGGSLEFQGKLDLLNRNLELDSVPTSRLPLTFRFRVKDYLVRPRWVAGLQLDGLALPRVLETARHFGFASLERLQAQGMVYGEVHFSPETGFKGGFLLERAIFSDSTGFAAHLERASVIVEPEGLRMPPTRVLVGQNEPAMLEASYSFTGPRLNFHVASAGMPVSALRSASMLLSATPIPDFFSRLKGGRWSGELAFKRDGADAGAWSGNIEINECTIELPSFERPVLISIGKGTVSGAALSFDHLEAASGLLRFQGRYAYTPGARRPHRLSGKIPEIQADELERIMSPILRRSRGLLARALKLPGRRERTPEWLANLRIEGDVEVDSLKIGGQQLEAVKVKFFWDGQEVDVPGFSAFIAKGRLHGYLKLNLGDGGPYYKLAGRFSTNEAREFRLVADGLAETRGNGEDLLHNLRAEGSVRIQPPPLAGVVKEGSLSALWSAAWERRQWHARLFQVRLDNGRQIFTGEGSVTSPDKVEIELSGEDGKFRLTGALNPLSLEIEPVR